MTPQTILSDREICERADAIRARAYRATVQTFVDDLLAEVRAGRVCDAGEARDYLEQSIDGCHDVIVTRAAQDVLRYSDHDGAYFEQYGADGAVEHGAIQWSRLASAALEADVYEALAAAMGTAEYDALDALFRCEDCEQALDAEDIAAWPADAARQRCAACREDEA